MDYSLITNESLDYCVYAHINKINGKMYIGITNNPKNRWSKNGRQYSGCAHFYNAIQKYGWDNFDHIVIIDNISLSMAYEIEKYMIKKYDTIKNGYNIKQGGEGGGILGENHYKSKPIYQYDLDGNFIKKWDAPIYAEKHYKINDVTRVANGIGITAAGYQWSYDYHDNIGAAYDMIPIYQYDLDGEYIKEWNNVQDAIKTYGNSIKNCANGYIRTSYEFRWSFEKLDRLDPLPPIEYMKNKNGYELINGKYQKKYPRVFQYDLNHNLVKIHENIQDITEDETELEYLKSLCKKNTQMVHDNYIWIFENLLDDQYIDDLIAKHNNKYRGVDQYDLDGNFIASFDSISDAEKQYGFQHGGISRVCIGKTKTAHNYQWRYHGDDAPGPIKHNLCNKMPVIQKTLGGEYIATYRSAAAASGAIHNTNTFNGNIILRACRGEQPQAYGYIWEFAS